jgi:hypothetical protein
MIWHESHRADRFARELADRHYNRQSIGAVQFVPPGRCAVLYAEPALGHRAFWVTSWPFAEYVRHAWPGAWICSAFRNEGAGVASDLIRSALAATRHKFGDPPALGMVTFLNRKFVKPIMVRGKPTFGRTWEKARFRHVGETKGGLMAFQIQPGDIPSPAAPLAPVWQTHPVTPLRDYQADLFERIEARNPARGSGGAAEIES